MHREPWSSSVCLSLCLAAAGITATPMVGPFLTGKPDATQEGELTCLHIDCFRCLRHALPAVPAALHACPSNCPPGSSTQHAPLSHRGKGRAAVKASASTACPGCPALPAEVERLLADTSVLKGVPLLPSDIANGMLFLASDMARCVNVSVNWCELGRGCLLLLATGSWIRILMLQLAFSALLCCASNSTLNLHACLL